MISILLHRQNLNLVIFGWTELLILKDFVIWCKNRCWHWHEQISLVHMPLVSHHHQSVTQTVRSSQQRSLLLRGSRSWSLNQGKLTLRSIEPHWGSEERTHKNTEHTELTHQADCPAVVTMCHMGLPFCWLIGFRLQLTIPPFLYFFYSQGSKSSAAFIFGTNTKLNLHSAEFPWLVLKYRTPNCVIRIKGKCTVPYLSDSKPNGRVP